MAGLVNSEVGFVEGRDKRQVAVIVVVVESVSNNKDIGNLKTVIVGRDIHFTPTFLYEQHGRANTSGSRRLQRRYKPPQRLSRVEDVVHDQHVSIPDVWQQSCVDSQISGLRRWTAITRRMHHANPMRNIDGPHQVSQEQHASGQNTHDRQRLTFVLSSEFRTKVVDPLLDDVRIDQMSHAVARFQCVLLQENPEYRDISAETPERPGLSVLR